MRVAFVIALVAAALAAGLPAASAKSPPKPYSNCAAADVGKSAKAADGAKLTCALSPDHKVRKWVPASQLASGAGNGKGSSSGGGGSGGSSGGSGGGSGGGSQTPPFVTLTASPVDLTQILKISLFRSCSGHDFSGDDVDGQRETSRSMKHYFDPLPSLTGPNDTVKIFSPVDGTIWSANPEGDPRGNQVWVGPAQDGWNVILFHTHLLSGFGVGTKVTAGELIGYASIPLSYNNFDVGYALQSQHGAVYDSIFNHMSTSVLQAFAARGITPANIIVSKAARDAAPCTVFQDTPDQYVTLTG